MKIKLLFIFSFTLLMTACQLRDAKELLQVSEKVNGLKKVYAPDRRVARFDIELIWDDEQMKVTGVTDQQKAYQELTQYLDSIGLPWIDDISVLPDSMASRTPYGVINNSVANIRSESRHSSELATQALLGAEVKVLQVLEEWYLVQTEDKYISWVDHGGVILMTSDEVQEWRNAEKVIFTGVSGNVLDKEGVQVSDIVWGGKLRLLQEVGDRYLIAYPDGRKGYLDKKDAKRFVDWSKEVQLDEDAIEESAKSFIGVPYLWGGTSAKGMDCSGFTKTVYRMSGLELSRDASQQVKQGNLVQSGEQFEHLRKGDLLFFGREATDSTGRRVTHVGIWIGNQQMIHSSEQVRISSFDEKHRLYDAFNLNRFLEARRFF